MMQTQLPPALAALMQTAQMVDPNTRRPTVAAQVAEAAMQKMQLQAAPPGIEALLPGAEVQAAQSAQAAQPATQGDLNRLRQMMAQAPQGQGIAAGADVQMAEGGIVGYAGPDGSSVEVDETALPVGERTKRALRRLYERIETGYMQRAGATPEQIAKKLGTEAPVTPQEAPVASYDHEGRIGIASKPMPVAALVSPAPADRKKRAPAPAPAPAPSAPIETMMDTRNIPMPSEARDLYEATQRRIEELGRRLSKPTPETPEQQAYRKAQEDQYNRGIAAIDQQRQRFEDAENARREALKGQGMENLISRLARVGGAGSLFQGLGRAQLGMEPIIAAQRAAEQTANEKKIQYFDLLDQRKDAVEGLRLAALKEDAARVAAETARLRNIDAEITKLSVGLGEKQAGERLSGEQAMARTQAEIAGRAQEGALNRAQQAEIEGKRLQQQAEQNGQIQLANRINAANMTVASAYDKLNKALAPYATFAKQMETMPDMLKIPANAAQYQKYLDEKARLEKTIVHPAEEERDRLARMINATQDLSKWGTPKVKAGG